MKKISLIALLMLMMTVVSFQGKAQEIESETVIIRLIENYTRKDGVMSVTHAGKTNEYSDLPSLSTRNIQKSGDENAVILEQEINRWKKQGFQVTELAMSSGTAYIITTVILSK